MTPNTSAPPSGGDHEHREEERDDDVSSGGGGDAISVTHNNCIAIGPCEACPRSYSQV